MRFHGQRTMFIFHHANEVIVYRKSGKIDTLDWSSIRKVWDRLFPVLNWNYEENCESNVRAFAEPGVPLEIVYPVYFSEPLIEASVIPKSEVLKHPDAWRRCPVCGHIVSASLFSNHKDICGLCKYDSPLPNESWAKAIESLRECPDEQVIYFNEHGIAEARFREGLAKDIEACKRPVFLNVHYTGRNFVHTYCNHRNKLVPVICESASTLDVDIVPESALSCTHNSVSLGEGGYIDADLKDRLDKSNR